MEDYMGDVHTDEAREARCLLATAFETVHANPATAGDSMLCAVRRRYASRRRTRALVSAGVAAAAVATAAAVLLSATVAAAPSALAAVSSALSRAAAGSFRMKLIVTQHNTVPAPLGIKSPLRITGKLDLKRSLAQTTVFVASGKPHSAGKMIYRAHFTFSDFGIRLSVTPPPAGQINHEIGAAVQF
jgi:hypothetical protein